MNIHTYTNAVFSPLSKTCTVAACRVYVTPKTWTIDPFSIGLWVQARLQAGQSTVGQLQKFKMAVFGNVRCDLGSQGGTQGSASLDCSINISGILDGIGHR